MAKELSGNEFRVTTGVWQDYVLRQYLLLICVNDLPEGMTSYFNVFADDKIKVHEGSEKQGSLHFKGYLDRLQSWSDT